ncbi:galactosylceramide sulfotransferase-like [Penaeus monodon]|uniref:galactosylceramide sulfotransferase-like n=1 Tax=Penaeus monodon TaxID=6687 RepID=UPI0018A72D2A|nr:galactosylceramide sulfotransferase-like [Penaeus monodon]XP_037803072.1 galactosylceramide sulfotransferase-like [Penaeus monodon]
MRRRSKLHLMWILPIVVCLIFLAIHTQKTRQLFRMSKHVRNLEGPSKPCVRQDSVYFLKVAKCASTTSLQIFVAYGVKHGLTFALPVRTGPIPISSKNLPPEYHGSPDGRYNMVVSHTQFSKAGAQQVMKESAKYVAVVREPAARFESMWYFAQYEKKLGISLTAYINASQRTSKQNAKLNVIANYFGVRDPRDDVPEGEVLSKAKWLNESFDLVMVAERFDESLVLLKHLMCWNTEDVAYVNAKIRRPTYRVELSEAQKNRLRQLNRQDVLLYKFFSKIFEEKVKAFGEERMQREVEELRQANARLIDDCGAELTGSRGTVKMWKVTNDSSICKMITMDGPTIHEQLKNRQKKWVSSNLTYDLSTWTFT